MALSLSDPRIAVPNGGRYPPSRPLESGLSSAACPRTQAATRVAPPYRLSSSAAAIIAPATNSSSSYAPGLWPNNPQRRAPGQLAGNHGRVRFRAGPFARLTAAFAANSASLTKGTGQSPDLPSNPDTKAGAGCPPSIS